MTTINVPVINEAPNTISVSFVSEFAVPFESANPDGVPGNCSTGGPGILGGPEYVNLLQRVNPSTAQNGFAYENFELASYPNHTFFSVKNFSTGVKKVVAFLKSAAFVPTPATAAATVTASGSMSTATTETATVPIVANAVSYVWSGTAINTQTSVVTGVSVNTLTFVVTSSTGSKTLICTITDELGNIVPSDTLTVTVS